MSCIECMYADTITLLDHPEFTEDINDVWKNTGPGAAISRGGETAPDVGDYGPLNARGT